MSLKAPEMTVAELKNLDVLEGYIKGLEDHRTDLYIGRDIENTQVPQSDFERVNQLLTPAYAGRLKNIEPKNLVRLAHCYRWTRATEWWPLSTNENAKYRFQAASEHNEYKECLYWLPSL